MARAAPRTGTVAETATGATGEWTATGEAGRGDHVPGNFFPFF